MKDHREIVELNKTQSKEYELPCGKCLVETSHRVLVSVDVEGDYETGDSYWEAYQTVQCQGCQTVSFRKWYRSTFDMEEVELPNGQLEHVFVDRVELYPSRIAGRSKLKRNWLLPKQVLQVYEESHSALSNKLTILGGIGLRVLIESVCKVKEAKGATLEQRIDNLVTLGVLTKDAADILHMLRDFGNEAAHEMKSQDEESLDLSMDVVENLLQSVFILPRAAKIKGRDKS